MSRRTIAPRDWRQQLLPSTASQDGDRIEIRLAQRLDSPNAWGAARSNWKKAAARTSLRVRLAMAVDMSLRVKLPRVPPETRRMRVTVTRLVPSERNFIRDTDNLMFCTKPLRDALKDLALIRDDSQRWLETDLPRQERSPDGCDWTIVVLEPAQDQPTP